MTIIGPAMIGMKPNGILTKKNAMMPVKLSVIMMMTAVLGMRMNLVAL